MESYKSSVMLFHDEEDHNCPTCKFLGGDTSIHTMMMVIKNLDKMLYESEQFTRKLTTALSDKVNA